MSGKKMINKAVRFLFKNSTVKTKFIFLIFFIFISCGVETTAELRLIENLLEVELEEGFEILNEQYDFAIGDSVLSFDLVFEETAFDEFFKKVEHIFIPIDKTIILNKNLDYSKNWEFDGSRIHMSINLSEKTLHYANVDL